MLMIFNTKSVIILLNLYELNINIIFKNIEITLAEKCDILKGIYLCIIFFYYNISLNIFSKLKILLIFYLFFKNILLTILFCISLLLGIVMHFRSVF